MEANEVSATCVLSIYYYDDKIAVYIHGERSKHGREGTFIQKYGS
jgi:hypothetical protein